MFLGILFTTTILLSGSATAVYVYGVSIYGSNLSTNTNSILGAPDSNHATLGQNPSSLGYIVVDLGASNAMPASTQFTVFADGGGITEYYTVSVSEDMTTESYVGYDSDSGDKVFYTPSSGSSWRYIRLAGATGSTSVWDPIYGPEIDAVGWDK
jgi:hypothetical protein